MYNHLRQRENCRKKRTLRVRKNLRGTGQKPRLCVIKSNLHIYAQLVDDDAGITLASYSSMHKDFDKTIRSKSKESAKVIGKKIAELAQKNNVTNLIMDRGRNKYHGLIAELVATVRECGIVI